MEWFHFKNNCHYSLFVWFVYIHRDAPSFTKCSFLLLIAVLFHLLLDCHSIELYSLEKYSSFSRTINNIPRHGISSRSAPLICVMHAWISGSRSVSVFPNSVSHPEAHFRCRYNYSPAILDASHLLRTLSISNPVSVSAGNVAICFLISLFINICQSTNGHCWSNVGWNVRYKNTAMSL